MVFFNSTYKTLTTDPIVIIIKPNQLDADFLFGLTTPDAA